MNRSSINGRSLRIAAFGLFLGSALLAQDNPPEPAPPADAPQETAAAPATPARGGGPTQGPQPFEKVVTKDAKTSKGLFAVHQVKERYYYEIPKRELDKEFLWNTQIAKTTVGAGYGGGQLNDRVVRWELKGDRVLLRDVNFTITADPNSPISKAVSAANNDAIIMAFNVAAYSKDGDPVIEITRLLTADLQEFSARQRLGATGVDQSRTFIERITPFPDNVEAEVTITYTRGAGGPGAAAQPAPAPAAANTQMRPGSATVVLHHSLVRLPEKPMMPRRFDERVGFFTTTSMDYSHDEYKAERIRNIARWRLEKKDPSAALSEPVTPIVYYIDPATPTKLVPWIKKGVEDWNVAFEAAGFKNAIQAKDAPTPEQDSNWSPEDVRNSVIRWLPSTTENASGPHISDPRTGEILNADIQVYNNVLNLVRDWYFVQSGPLDPRAQKLPLPDELMGRLIQHVISHEVGHTLGLQHNMKASSMYPQEKVRDKEWLKTMGHTPSIMDYSRFNYVAQPEDGIDPADLIPRIGPYDIWAIHWGYAPIDAAKTSDAEKPTLDKWAREQDDKPWLRFDTANSGGSDPGEETEAVGDADAVKSTALGVKNLQRVEKMLMSATAYKQGDTYEQLSELYTRTLEQWTREMNHVAGIVGGFNSQEKVVGQEGRIFNLMPKEKQQEAVKYLLEAAFATPSWLIDEEILRRIEAVGAIAKIHNAQTSVLNNLLNSARFSRLAEQEALDGQLAYSPVEFVSSVRRGLWKELDGASVKIDPYRRELQRSYLDSINTKLNPPAPAGNAAAVAAAAAITGRANLSGDEKSLYRADLRALSNSISAALLKSSDAETKAHLEASRDEIAKILDPGAQSPAGARVAAR